MPPTLQLALPQTFGSFLRPYNYSSIPTFLQTVFFITLFSLRSRLGRSVKTTPSWFLHQHASGHRAYIEPVFACGRGVVRKRGVMRAHDSLKQGLVARLPNKPLFYYKHTVKKIDHSLKHVKKNLRFFGLT